MNRRHVLLISLAAAASLAACSGPYTVSADVASFGNWPSGRSAGTYAFERLPSQQLSKRQAELEFNARPALERAGFKPAADAKSADVLISLGAQVSAQDYPYWGDPMWWGWRGGLGYGRYGRYGGWRYAGLAYGPWGGYGPYGSAWGPAYGWADRRYAHEVAVLVRDRQSNEALFEAHASTESMMLGDAPLVEALYTAALSDFPQPKPDSHRVSVVVTPKSQ